MYTLMYTSWKDGKSFTEIVDEENGILIRKKIVNKNDDTICLDAIILSNEQAKALLDFLNKVL